MSYTEFDNQVTASTGEVITASGHNDEIQGIQDEFEERMEAQTFNGVTTGMACSINGTSVDVASGTAYVEGKRYSGSASVSFVGQNANTYYVYILPTDDVTPYTLKTTGPTSGQLTLCSVVWSGAALSSLTDLREWGLGEWDRCDYVSGSITTGCVGFWVSPAKIWIRDIKISCLTKPTGSSIIVDLRRSESGATPTTLFTLPAYRPTFTTASDPYTVITNTGVVYTDRILDMGDVIGVWVDQTDSSSAATGLTFTIRGNIISRD